MRITIVQGAFLPIPPLLGGAVEKMWFLLGQEFVKRGHEVIHISRHFEDLPTNEIIAGVLHQRVKGYATPRNGVWLKFLDLIYSLRVIRQNSGTDVVVTNTFWLPILMGFSAADRVYVDVARMPKGQMRLYRRSARLRANSSAVESAIHLDDPKSIDKTCVIPNPLTFSTSVPVDFSGKNKSILYTGRIHPEKGIELLIQAFVRLSPPQRGMWRLKIIGPYETSMGGGGREWMNGLRRKYADVPIDWLEPIFDANELNNEYHLASIFAYPSLAERGETFGLAPLEAMAWGTVPVVSDLACFHDFIEDRFNGRFFDHRGADPVQNLADVLSTLISNSTDRLRMSEKATEVRVSHDVGTIAEMFLADFQKICDSRI